MVESRATPRAGVDVGSESLGAVESLVLYPGLSNRDASMASALCWPGPNHTSGRKNFAQGFQTSSDQRRFYGKRASNGRPELWEISNNSTPEATHS
jgi:hypothetical protein